MADHTAATTSPRASSAPRAGGAPGYTRTAIALHWLVALFILGSFVVGTYMVALDLSPWKLKVYSWHKWDGVTIFLLVVVRLVWRLFHPAPPLPATMRPWEHNVAGVAHALLYLLMLAVPISGWLMSSAAGIPVVYFGVLQLPDLVAKNKELFELLKTVHYVLNKTLLALIVLHVAAAVKHHVVDRDDVLVRMLPFLARRKGKANQR